MTPIATHLALVQAQLDHYPDSVVLNWGEFINECLGRRDNCTNIDGSPINWLKRLVRYQDAYPHALPYMLKGPHAYLGLRFGTDGSEYISGFPERP